MKQRWDSAWLDFLALECWVLWLLYCEKEPAQGRDLTHQCVDCHPQERTDEPHFWFWSLHKVFSRLWVCFEHPADTRKVWIHPGRASSVCSAAAMDSSGTNWDFLVSPSVLQLFYKAHIHMEFLSSVYGILGTGAVRSGQFGCQSLNIWGFLIGYVSWSVNCLFFFLF